MKKFDSEANILNLKYLVFIINQPALNASIFSNERYHPICNRIGIIFGIPHIYIAYIHSWISANK